MEYHMNMHSYDRYKRCSCRPTLKTEGSRPNLILIRQLKAVSVPSKLRILTLLKEAPHCVCDLMTHAKLSQTLASHHLSDLAKIGLVKSNKKGAFVDYSLTDKGRRLIVAIQTLIS